MTKHCITNSNCTHSLHYNNCTGASLVGVILLDGTEISAEEFTLTQDEKLCNISVSGATDVKDVSHLVLQPVNPSNGLNSTVTVYVNGTPATGIETMKNEELRMENEELRMNDGDAVYDLTGRRVKSLSSRGIYVKQGKKVFLSL